MASGRTLTTFLRTLLSARYTNNGDLINPTGTRDNIKYLEISKKIVNGIGDSKANLQHYSRRRLVNSTEVLNLDGDLTNRWGDSLNFDDIKVAVIFNREDLGTGRFIEVTFKDEKYHIGPQGFRLLLETPAGGVKDISSSDTFDEGNLTVSSNGDVTYDLIFIGSGFTIVPGYSLWLNAESNVQSGGSRQFTLANEERFTRPDEALLSTGDIDFTIAVWVYLDTKAADAMVVAKFNTSSNREFRLFYVVSSNKFTFSISNDGLTETFRNFDSLGSSISTGTWHFLIVDHDSINNTISVQGNNGTIDSSAHSTGVFDSTAAFEFGTRDGSAVNLLDGRMARVGYWKRTLTTAERTFLYNGGSGQAFNDIGNSDNAGSNLKDNLIGYWNLNEESGNAIDSFSNGLDLTDTNTVTSDVGPGLTSKPADGDPVQRWTDKSSNAHILLQDTRINQPRYRHNAINGKPAIEFDGTNDLLIKATAFLTGTKGSIFIIINADVVTNGILLSSSDEATNVIFIYSRIAGASDIIIQQRNNDTEDRVDTTNIIITNKTYLLSFLSDGSKYRIRINGIEEVLILNSGLNNGDWFGDSVGLDNVVIGASKGTFEGVFFDGLIPSIIVYDDLVLTSEDIDEVEAALASEYGITLG